MPPAKSLAAAALAVVLVPTPAAGQLRPAAASAEREFQPLSPGARVTFALDDADLAEVARVMSQVTGRRFTLAAKVRDIKATVVSPDRITVAEAYRGFLSLLAINGLTVIPHGRFLEITESAGSAARAPVSVVGEAATREERYVTQLVRLRSASAEEVASILAHFKSKDADITVHSSTNLLVVTDTATNVRRLLSMIEDLDIGSATDKIWLEPIHYASATELAKELGDVLAPGGAGSAGKPLGGSGAAPPPPRGGSISLSRIFAEERSNSLVLIGSEPAYLQALELVRRLDVPLTSQGQIRVLPLQHADATELTRTLVEIVGAGGGPPGGGGPGPAGSPASAGIFEGRIKVSADKATNALVVTCSARDFAQLRGVVDRLDHARRQVFIDAVILDLSVSASSNVGIDYHAGATTSSSSGDGLVYGGLNPLKTIGLPDSSSLQGLALGVRGPGLAGTSSLLGTGVTIPAFGITFDALAHTEGADVLSTPTILATDNVPAEINVGQNIPLQTNVGGGASLASLGGSSSAASALGGGSQGTTGAAPRQDVGTKLKIIAHLNDSDEVRLELSEEISEAGATPTGSLGTIPIVKRTAQTTLTVRDQQSAVVGGLMRRRTSHSVDKVPVLGDIPLLGFLFRQSTDDSQRTNLVLVVTPYIIREQSDLRAIFERKMQERQQFLDHYFVFGPDSQPRPAIDLGRSRGLLGSIRENYLQIEADKALEELRQPRDVLTHEPSAPVPAPRVAPAADSTLAPPAP